MMNYDQEADIRRAIIFAFGDKPGKLKKVLKVLEKMIPEMQELQEERLADYYMGRGPHP
jgi:prephenate dehydratase